MLAMPNPTENEARVPTQDQWMVLCAGLYWATILLGNFDLGSGEQSSSIVLGVYFIAFYLIFLLTIFLATCLEKKFVSRRAQKILAWVSAVISLLVVIASIPLLTPPQSFATFLNAAQAVREACYIMFWGLNFTALDKSQAERITIASLSFAFLLYLAISLLVRNETAIVVITNLMMVASLIPFLANRYSIDVVRRPDVTPNKKLLTPFYVSRIFLGACLGTAMFLCAYLEDDTTQRAIFLSLIGIAILAFSLWDMHRKSATNLTFLRLAPLVACGAIICPYMNTDKLLVSLCGHAPAIVWMCWIILHSVQISAIKEESGLDDALLSFTEKLAFMASAVLTAIVLAIIPQLTDVLVANDQLVYASLGVLIFVVVVVCSYQLNIVIDGKETERIVDSVNALNEQRNEPVYERIGDKYGLTPRERDVFRLLAKGMARPAICEELCISEGTERTHVRHIYQKLDVHSRDELMALVEKETREQLAGQQGDQLRGHSSGAN